ncbi:MAG: MBL fold metallo-hydrolase [Planctomycetota bacterium]
MHIQVLSSGSEGNSALIRAGETNLLVDAGLPLAEMEARIEAARIPLDSIGHVLVTHGHLDHARSAGGIARKARGMLHCAESIMKHPSARRARHLSTIAIGRPFEIGGTNGDAVQVRSVVLPHDCDPTVAFRIEHRGRAAAILTDIGRPSEEVARALEGCHVVVLEFNYDPEMMRNGPYPDALKKRITGERGHLSNEQSATMLAMLAGRELHTVVLAHLSSKNNTAELALSSATAALARLGRADVRVLVASQHEVGENLAV